MQHIVLLAVSGFDQFGTPLRVSNKKLLKKKLRNINNQLMLILKLYGDLLPVSLLGAFSHAVLGIRDFSDHF